MITKRIIPCLDVRDGRVVKGVNFLGVRDVSDPVKLAQYYSESGADELVFYDITATVEGRALFTDILTRVAETIFIPLTVGGGIQTLADFDRVLKCGADKVSVNSGALRDPDLIRQGAERYGNQCVVLSVDAKRVDGAFHVFSHGGRQDTGLDAIDWICRGVDLGAGEIVLNSIDTDGVKQGFDLGRCLPGRQRAGHRLRRGRLRGGLCRAFPGPAPGRRWACRLYFPLWRGPHPCTEAHPGRSRHQYQEDRTPCLI